MKLTHLLIAAIVAVAPGLGLAGERTAFDEGMQPILQSYLTIHDALADDKMAGVAKAAAQIARAAKRLDAGTVQGAHAEHYKLLPKRLQEAAEKLAGQEEIAKAREAFRELSRPMAMWGSMAKPSGVWVAFCSMAEGSWLQKKGAIRNPYYGKSMLGCGEVVGGDVSKPGQ